MTNQNQLFARALGLAIVLACAPSFSLGHVRISQIYGGGNASGATFRQDYIELYNPAASSVDLGGWSLQYTSATGTNGAFSTIRRITLSGSIAAHGYYLVSISGTTGSGNIAVSADVIVTADQFGTNVMSSDGRVALVSNTDLVNVDPATWPLSDPDIVDFVGYGPLAQAREGSEANADNAPIGTATTALFRRADGCVDTDNNAADFFTAAPSPRTTPTTNDCSTTHDLAAIIDEAADPVNLGQNIVLTARALNAGQAASPANITLQVTLPAGAALVSSVPPADSQAGQTLTYSIPGPIGASSDVSFVVTFTPSGAGFHQTTATVSASPADSFPGDDSRTVKTGVFNPAGGKIVIAPGLTTAAIDTGYVVDAATGVAKRFLLTQDLDPLPPSGAPQGPLVNFTGLAADDANRVFYAAASSGNFLYRIPYDNPAPEHVARFTNSGSNTNYAGLGFYNGVLYASDNQQTTPSSLEGFYSINSATAASTPIYLFNTLNAQVDIDGFDMDPVTGDFLCLNDATGGLPNGTGRGIYRITQGGVATFLEPYDPTGDFPGSQARTDVDGLAVGGGRLYLVPDEPGVIAVYNLATDSYEAQIPCPLQARFDSVGAAYTEVLFALPCPSDIDHNHAVDADDLFAFLDLWFAQNGASGAGLAADINNTGNVDADDLFAFLDLWFAANGQPCP